MSHAETGCDVLGQVGTITLRRSHRRNALTRQLLEQLQRHVQQLASDSRVRVIRLQSEGPVFCAGMDLAEMEARAKAADAALAWRADALVFCELVCQLLMAPQPVVAAVQGPVVAGGVGLVLACDLVVAADGAYFSLPEPQRGITAAMVTPLLLYRLGAAHAARCLLSGESLSAADAQSAGLCHDVVSSSQLAARVTRLCDGVCSGAPTALAATKAQLRQAYPLDLLQQVRQAAEASAQSRETAEAREGLQAFLEKRVPSWQAKA